MCLIARLVLHSHSLQLHSPKWALNTGDGVYVIVHHELYVYHRNMKVHNWCADNSVGSVQRSECSPSCSLSSIPIVERDAPSSCWMVCPYKAEMAAAFILYSHLSLESFDDSPWPLLWIACGFSCKVEMKWIISSIWFRPLVPSQHVFHDCSISIHSQILKKRERAKWTTGRHEH